MFDFSDFSLLNWLVGVAALIGGGFVAFWVIYGLYTFREILLTGLVMLFMIWGLICLFVIIPAMIGSWIL